MNIIILVCTAIILILCMYHIKHLNEVIENKSTMFIYAYVEDLGVGDEVTYAKGRKGIILRCPSEGQSYTILTKNGSIKFIKEANLVKTGRYARELVDFLNKWRDENGE